MGSQKRSTRCAHKWWTEADHQHECMFGYNKKHKLCRCRFCHYQEPRTNAVPGRDSRTPLQHWKARAMKAETELARRDALTDRGRAAVIAPFEEGGGSGSGQHAAADPPAAEQEKNYGS